MKNMDDDNGNVEDNSRAAESDELSSSNDSTSYKQQQQERSSVMDRSSAANHLHFNVAASPPKFVSFDDVMRTADGISNMALAHEIAVDNEFKLEKFDPPENSMEKQVKDIMHKAFWDSLEEKLKEDPPDYSHGLMLLAEIKEALMSILLPQHNRLQAHINEVLDLELIEQKVEYEVLDFHYYADFVISIMSRMCAPVRDENIADLREITEIVPLFREIFSVIDLMKMDMANFTIQQMRPYIQQHSVEYERKKFQEFLKQQQENDMDGLVFTKDWLQKTYDKVEMTSQNALLEASAPVPMVTPASILNEAYLELLAWDERRTFPETMVMDEGRILDLKDKTQQLTMVSAILLVTYNMAGAGIAGITGFKTKLKNEINILLDEVPEYELESKIEGVGDHVIRQVNECLHKHGFQEMDASKQKSLKGQIKDVLDKNHPVRRLLYSRVIDFIRQVLTTCKSEPMKIPPGLSAVEPELSAVCGHFCRLMSHNRSVFGLYYADIMATITKRNVDLSPRN
ncbi:T-complex protein 11-like protein 1 isoform X2 [Tubulanus polymorphus]